ncbi:MAG: rhodanese-like domain-containing protein [Bdellovibrionales bacterium]|nr:rhodanese-like domain-containing protein [Bdellovibrionales bacterium]
MKVLSILLAVVLCGSIAQAKKVDCKDDSRYPNVSTANMEKLVAKNDVTIIDVNSKSSFKDARVTGAVHFGTNQDKLAKVLPKDKNAMVVAYCGGESCTAWKRAAHAACEMGYTNVHHYSAGITGWKSRKKNM